MNEYTAQLIKDKYGHVVPCYVGGGRKTIIYNALALSFDIETTLIPQSQHTYMYHAQFALEDWSGKDIVYRYRTWNDVLDFIKTCALYNYDLNTIQFVTVANLSYEMSFLLRRLENDTDYKIEVFADKPRKPLYVNLLYKDRIVLKFIDILRISGMSLAVTAKNYCKTQKCIGDLNYSKIRNSLTPLSDDELKYCDNDVLICNEFFRYLVHAFWKHGKRMPYTSTGILRDEVKQHFKTDNYYENENDIRENIASLMPKTLTEYMLVSEWLFQGGVTHANYKYVGKVVNAKCFDFTSSYPSVMLHEKTFPMSPFKSAGNTHDYNTLKRHPAWYCILTLYNVTATTSHTVISKHKCMKISSDAIIDNGRIYKAKRLTIMVNNIDMSYIELFYSWTKDYCTHPMYCDYVDKLPAYLLTPVLECGKAKANLKQMGLSHTPEYATAKAKYNAGYGLMVQKHCNTSYTYADGAYIPQDSESYAKVKATSILSCYWGIWVTSYARRNLLFNLYNCEKAGANVVYYDTDSLYITEWDKCTPVIEEWNDHMKTLNEELPEEFFDLGCFDEDPECIMKTLGAKRYVKVVNNKVKATIAGMRKKSLLKQYEKYKKTHKHEQNNVFDFFDSNMHIETYFADKLASKYTDTETSDVVTDEYGNTETMTELSSVSLIPVDFTLKIKKEWLQWANSNQ